MSSSGIRVDKNGLVQCHSRHCTVPTNQRLHKIKIASTDACKNCAQNDTQTNHSNVTTSPKQDVTRTLLKKRIITRSPAKPSVEISALGDITNPKDRLYQAEVYGPKGTLHIRIYQRKLKYEITRSCNRYIPRLPPNLAAWAPRVFLVLIARSFGKFAAT
jgi:hypothetical protein